MISSNWHQPSRIIIDLPGANQIENDSERAANWIHSLDRATDMIYRYARLAIASCDHSSSPKNQISQLPWSQPVQPPRPPYQQSRSHCHREPGAPNHASHINESCTHELSSILLERDKPEWIMDEVFRHVDSRQSQRRFDQHTSNFLHTVDFV